MQISGDNPILTGVSIQPDGIILMTLGGNISTEEHGTELIAWVEKSKQLISEQKEKNAGRALCLIDINSLRDFDEGSVKILAGLASIPEISDVNTAVFGATMFTKMRLKIIIRLSGRKNIRHFDTTGAAIAWLKSEQTT